MYENFMPYENPMFSFDPRYEFAKQTRCNMPNMPNMSLIKAYFLSQPYNGIFPINEALYRGTAFPNLYEAFPGPIGQFDNRRI